MRHAGIIRILYWPTLLHGISYSSVLSFLNFEMNLMALSNCAVVLVFVFDECCVVVSYFLRVIEVPFIVGIK